MDLLRRENERKWPDNNPTGDGAKPEDEDPLLVWGRYADDPLEMREPPDEVLEAHHAWVMAQWAGVNKHD